MVFPVFTVLAVLSCSPCSLRAWKLKWSEMSEMLLFMDPLMDPFMDTTVLLILVVFCVFDRTARKTGFLVGISRK